MYLRECNILNFYYEAIQINVGDSGYYSFKTCTTLKTLNYIYKNNFNPLNPHQNILAKDDQSGGNNPLELGLFLQADITYIFVVTTFSSRITGEFSIYAWGPKNITAKLISEYIYYLVDVIVIYNFLLNSVLRGIIKKIFD